MAERRLGATISSVAFYTVGTTWFAYSVATAMVDSDVLGRLSDRHFQEMGISLPWGALLWSMAAEEQFPREAKRVARLCLTVAALLTAAAAVHHFWLDPVLGRALLQRQWPPLRRALSGMGLHEILLTVHGPLLSLASWYWLRSMSRLPEGPPPRLAGSHVKVPAAAGDGNPGTAEGRPASKGPGR